MTLLTEDERFAMINLRGRTTGLPMNIWIGPRGGARHAARIKVQMDHRERFDFENLAVVSLDPKPQLVEGALSASDLELVSRYIALNYLPIIAHWNEVIDGVELARALRPLT